MTQKERMLAGLPYRANDPELKQMRAENKLRVAQYNQLTRNQEQEMDQLIKEIWSRPFTLTTVGIPLWESVFSPTTT